MRPRDLPPALPGQAEEESPAQPELIAEPGERAQRGRERPQRPTMRESSRPSAILGVELHIAPLLGNLFSAAPWMSRCPQCSRSPARYPAVGDRGAVARAPPPHR